jgi:hypothetical protein
MDVWRLAASEYTDPRRCPDRQLFELSFHVKHRSHIRRPTDGPPAVTVEKPD